MLNIPKQLMICGWKIIESDSEPDNEYPRHHSEEKQIKALHQNLNSINVFLMSLVIAYVGYHFKLLLMYWYKNIRSFWYNL